MSASPASASRPDPSALESGQAMFSLIQNLYPVCRSITGEGVRETLRIVGRYIPLDIHAVPTGTQVFDWTVPKEWNIRDAYVKDSAGHKVIDFHESNLHVVNYSTSVHERMTLEKLRPHLFSLPDRPDWVPYKTSYYHETWGFCLSHNQLSKLPDDSYEVLVDASLEEGHLNYGECYLPGTSEEEILISCHICHPSLCNDNLSGIALSTFLARHWIDTPHRYSYRFLFIPGTIGAITWLARNEAAVGRIRHGLVVANVGDDGPMTYKKSRRGNAEIDRAVIQVLKHRGQPYEITDFIPYGYDERQFCSPGFDLPVGSLTRTPYGRYPQYHTSADDLGMVHPRHLGDSLETYLQVFGLLEQDRRYLNLNPKCEPQLGHRGLYRRMGGYAESKAAELAMLWVLNFSDGHHSLLDIAERANLPFEQLAEAAGRLCGRELLKECG
jgi:aminopeptidase-like protein